MDFDTPTPATDDAFATGDAFDTPTPEPAAPEVQPGSLGGTDTPAVEEGQTQIPEGAAVPDPPEPTPDPGQETGVPTPVEPVPNDAVEPAPDAVAETAVADSKPKGSKKSTAKKGAAKKGSTNDRHYLILVPSARFGGQDAEGNDVAVFEKVGESDGRDGTIALRRYLKDRQAKAVAGGDADAKLFEEGEEFIPVSDTMWKSIKPRRNVREVETIEF